MQLLIFIKQINYYTYLIVILNSLALYENYTTTCKLFTTLPIQYPSVQIILTEIQACEKHMEYLIH